MASVHGLLSLLLCIAAQSVQGLHTVQRIRPLLESTSVHGFRAARHSPVVTSAASAQGEASKVLRPLPGLLLSFALAYPADALAKRTSLSPLLWASVAGIATGGIWRALGLKQLLAPGVKLAKARLLRLGIILYGVKLTVQQIAGIGLAGLLADVFTVTSTMVVAQLVGCGVLRMSAPFVALIASGAAICGCSAVVATQPVAQGEPEEVAAAVGTVVLYGTIAMFLYPLLWSRLPFLADARLMGIFTGSTVHELAGVVAAGNAMTPQIASVALVTKLVRVCLLAPTLLLLARVRTSSNDGDAAAAAAPTPMPWFALGFVAVALLNSVVSIDRSLVKLAATASAFCLATSMAALGLDADFGKILALGPKPLLLATSLWLHLLLVCGSVTRLLVHALPL